MKKANIAIGLFSFLFLFTACQKNVLTPELDDLSRIALSGEKEVLDLQDIPSEIIEFIEENFAPIIAQEAFYVSELGYEVALEDSRFLYFNDKKFCLGDGSHIRGFGGEFSGMNFGPCGPHTGPHPHPGPHTGPHPHPHPGGFHCHCLTGEGIEASELPQEITDYIAVEYSDADVESVVLKMSGKYGVELSTGTNLLFDKNGNFIKECGMPGMGDGNWPGGEVIEISEAPDAIQVYIDTNYPDETVLVVVLRPNGNYFIKVTGFVKLVFDEDGGIIYDSGN